MGVLALLALLGFAGRAQALCVDGTEVQCTLNGQPGVKECVNDQWTPCMTHVPPPPALSAPTVSSRTHNRLTVNWSYSQQPGESYQLQYYAGSAWVGLVNLSSPAAYNHTGLQPDSKYCYRVRGTGGTHGPRTSGNSCRYTTDGTGRKAWRIQAEFHTGGVDDANTDDGISVVLNETSTNSTWVDYGRDDFERNDTFKYDLNLERLDFFSDINRIKLEKVGTDGWCLADFRLLVNEKEVYAENFHSLPGGCRWIDGNDGHLPTYTVSHATLRAHPSWQGYTEPPRISLDLSAYPQITATLRIPRDETESRIEGMMGDLIHGSPAYWGDRHGPRYVEASWAGFGDRLDVDLDLEASVDYWFDPELDIDFDLRFQARCSTDGTQAVVDITTENLTANVDFDWFAEVWSFILPCGPIATVIDNRPIPDCISAVEDYVGEQIEAGFVPIVQSQQQALPSGVTCQSASVAIDANANVDLIFQLRAPTPPPTPQPRPTPTPLPPLPPRR
jgi:hypothetical protein